MPGRLTIALAMWDGLERALFSDEHWARLDAVGDLVDRRPITDFVTAEPVLAGVEVLLTSWGCPPITKEVVAAAPRLGLVAHSAGTLRPHVTDAVWERGIRVTSAAFAGAPPVAEFTFAAIVFIGKDVFRAIEEFRAARGRTERILGRVNDARIGNVGQRIGVVGASYVGRLVVERLRTIEAEVKVFDPYLDAARAQALRVDAAALDDLLAWADIVTLHAPALPDTHHMIGAAELARLRDGAWLVNTARGWLVDEVALEAELVSGRINALIDTSTPEPLPPESPLYDLPNVVLTPHLAGAQGNELGRMADLAVTEIERFAAGEPALYPVELRDLERIA